MGKLGRIVALAEQIRSSAGLLKPPFSTQTMIDACMPLVKVSGAQLPKGVVGLTRITATACRVLFSWRLDPVRAREVIGHELGHIVLEPDFIGERRCTPLLEHVPTNEQQADRFGDELLVPQVLLAEDVPEVPDEPVLRGRAMRAEWRDLTFRLATRYNVTRRCILRRLEVLVELRAELQKGARYKELIVGIREALLLRDVMASKPDSSKTIACHVAPMPRRG